MRIHAIWLEIMEGHAELHGPAAVGIALVVLVSGVIFFRSTERSFADIV